MPTLVNKTSDEYEALHWPKGELVMGIDEAGRGPLCGPLVVASCVLPLNYHSDLIFDSKKLSEKKREMAFKQIKEDAIYYEIKIVSPKEIDELNIYAATKKAMSELASNENYNVILTDAMKLDIDKDVTAIVKGDMKSINIAAASILAKVTRDHIMMEYHAKYPELELDHHKGYPTKRHLELLEKYGLKDFYRMSYGPCKRLNEPKLF